MNKYSGFESEIESLKERLDKALTEYEFLKRWKEQHQIVAIKWNAIEDFMRTDPRLKPGQVISAYVLELLRHERMRAGV
ncbi:MAG: hypothetical protein WKF87_13440 [Chryseolinea sp.]